MQKAFQYILCSGWSFSKIVPYKCVSLVSIHPMFWLILGGYRCRPVCWNVSIHPMFWLIQRHQSDWRGTKAVSIHPMFWLIHWVERVSFAFYLVSIHPMFWLITTKNLQAKRKKSFNTSYVLVDLPPSDKLKWVDLFQYILCSGWSSIKRG